MRTRHSSDARWTFGEYHRTSKIPVYPEHEMIWYMIEDVITNIRLGPESLSRSASRMGGAGNIAKARRQYAEDVNWFFYDNDDRIMSLTWCLQFLSAAIGEEIDIDCFRERFEDIRPKEIQCSLERLQ